MKKLSNSKIKTLKVKDKRYSVTDGNGLYLDIMPSGRKSWTLKYKINNKETRKKLGEYPTLSLKDVRILAEERKRIAVMGEHDISMKKLIAEWFAIYSKNWSSKKYVDNVKYRLNLISKPFSNMQVSHVSRSIVTEAVKEIMAKGTYETARRSLRLLSQVFDYAIACEYTEVNPCANISKIIPENTVKHMAFLNAYEMPKFWQDVGSLVADYELKQALMLYCLLTPRPSELMQAKWSEIDFEQRIWTIPPEHMKKRKEHIIYLADKALTIFQTLHNQRIDDGYIFKNRLDPTRHRPRESALAIIKRAGYKGVMTTHGFRSLLSTTANESKLFDGDIIERHLAHFPSNKVRSAYNKAEYWEQRKELMIWWDKQTDEWFQVKSS